MFAALDPSEVAVTVMVPATIVYLLSVFLALRISKSLERSLILCGLFTGIFAVWYSLATAEGAVQIRAGAAGVSLGGNAEGVLGRIAVLLILSGLAVIIFNVVTDGSARREERIRE
jgi:hypothetical protein